MTSAIVLTADSGSGFTELVSRDADEVVEVLSRQLAPHSLCLRDPGQVLHARIATLPLGPAFLVHVGYGADVDVQAREFTEQYLIHAAIEGGTEICTGNRTVLMHSQNVPISCVGARPRFRMTSQCRHLVVRIERTALESYFSRALDRQIGGPVIFSPATAENAAFSTAWRNLLAHLHEQVAAVPELMAGKQMQRHYFGLMLEMLLQGPRHNYSQWLDGAGSPAASAGHVRRACALIDSRMSEPLSVQMIAREVGASVRSLQDGFRRSVGVTPLQFIRRRRLEQLHAKLESADPAASVTDIMLDCGIVNFGRFARYYRRRFGCRPSETLRKGRSGVE